MEKKIKFLLKSTVIYTSIASFGVSCFDQGRQSPVLMGKKDSKKLKSDANITNQNNTPLKQNEDLWLNASIQAKQPKSVLAHKYEESDNQENIDHSLLQNRLDNVSEEMATLDPIAPTKTDLKIENNQEDSMYIEIVNGNTDGNTSDNGPIYEKIIDTASYYETPRSSSNHQNLIPTNENLTQAHKSAAPIYQNRTDTNQDEEPIYEEIDLKKEEENNKNKKPIEQNLSSVSKLQDTVMGVFKSAWNAFYETHFQG